MKERQRGRERRDMREREGNFIFILLGSLYYFIRLYVKIRTEMLDVLLNELGKKDKSSFLKCKIDIFLQPQM